MLTVSLALEPGEGTVAPGTCIVDFPVTATLTLSGDTAALAEGVETEQDHTFAADSFDDCTRSVDVEVELAPPGDHPRPAHPRPRRLPRRRGATRASTRPPRTR